jgi:hypothetical protein
MNITEACVYALWSNLVRNPATTHVVEIKPSVSVSVSSRSRNFISSKTNQPMWSRKLDVETESTEALIL